MAKEICISSTPHETRLAILEDDQLAEIYYERENEYTLAGSIYNGRVTRVLPGMQSAFVDVGLERDAFLYVTDFLELEDPEEADEIEKAAATGGTQAPREVRSAGERQGGEKSGSGERAGSERPEGGEGRGGQRQSGRPDKQSQDRQPRERQPQNQNQERRLVVEAATDTEETVAPAAGPSAAQGDGGQEDGAGAKRWRGRRRRRGGRGAAGEQENQAGGEESSNESTESSSASPSNIQASAAPAEKPAAQSWATPARASAPASSSEPRGTHAPTPFVLPGESLRKYGGVTEDEAPKAAAPPRPASTFKPATLIEAPLAWDGSGLLPGESISKHRGRHSDSEPAAHSYDEPSAGEQEELVIEHDGIHIEPVLEPVSEAEIDALALETHGHAAEETAPHFAATDEEELKDAPLVHHEEVTEDPYSDDPSAPAEPIAPEDPGAETDEPAEEDDEEEFEETESASSDADSSASHHVDPAPPTGFRLFGLGGKKKAETPALTPEPPAAPKPATVTAVSAYAPGAGLIEEETIEEEEFDAPHHHAKTDDHDLEDYEEETLPAGMRTGDLGEMLQEAHLDHKIQLNFEDKNVDEESFDDDEDEDEEATADGQAAPNQGQDSSQQRRDRGGRGRRGGGRERQPAGQQGGGNRRGGGMTRRAAQTSDLPIISDLLKPGQEILVQIAKEPIAKKGARITSHIALPGRFLVFMPTVSHIGVSRKIASDEERQRLKRILVHERGEASGGFIVRTAAEGASEEELRADLRFLIHLWDEIKQRSDNSKSPALIYHDLSLIERILRDQVSSNFSSIWVDSQDDYERIVRFLNRFSPTLVRRVKMYNKEVPLFEHFGIQDEISKALRSKVWLKSGGSIVINQTEALVAIDINTGKYVGKSARLEDTIVKTNLDAVPEIVRQIRLRDLGGIIVIDFIDMDERKNRFRVLAALEEALKADRAPTKVLQFNDFGLVAITRKRVKQSLERTLSVPCPTCQATGMVKSPTTVCNEIYTELRKMKKHFESADVLLRVNPETVKVLKQNNASWLTEFEELVGKNILVKSDATLHPEQFDIQG
jgi:Rne/Rng family ribonuclease